MMDPSALPRVYDYDDFPLHACKTTYCTQSQWQQRGWLNHSSNTPALPWSSAT